MLRLLALLMCLPLPVSAQMDPSIGRLNTAGYRATEMCTAALIAPDLAVTAAHCVTRPEDGYLRRIADMVFVAGWDGGEHSGAAQVKSVRVHPDAYHDGRFDLRHDLAVVELGTALDLPTLPVGSVALPAPLTLAGYRRSRPNRLTVTPLCQASPLSGVWRIDCRVEPGQSGGPVLAGEGTTRRIVAVIVAVNREEQALAVPVDGWLRRQFAATR